MTGLLVSTGGPRKPLTPKKTLAVHAPDVHHELGRRPPRNHTEREQSVGSRPNSAPNLADTCRFYVDQIAVTSQSATARACDSNLRYFADWLIDYDPTIKALQLRGFTG
jgi:hypothetical protein